MRNGSAAHKIHKAPHFDEKSSSLKEMPEGQRISMRSKIKSRGAFYLCAAPPFLISHFSFLILLNQFPLQHPRLADLDFRFERITDLDAFLIREKDHLIA